MLDGGDIALPGKANGAEDRGAEPSKLSRDDFASGCVLVAAGSVAACAAAALWCTPPARPLPNWGALLVRCTAFFALTAAAGAAGIWALSLVRPHAPALRRRSWFQHALMGWIFLPGIALLVRSWPGWAIPVMAAAAAALAVSLQQQAPAPAEAGGDLPQPGGFPSFYGTRITGFHPKRAALIALCAQGALVFSVAKAFVPAGVVLALGVFLLLWYWSAEVGIAAVARRRGAFASGTAASAFLVLLLALLPWLSRRGGQVPPAANHMATAQAAERRPVLPHYTSVILWPPALRVTRLYFTAALPAKRDAALLKQPMEIPFDGPYWYFEPPDDEPGPMAHVAHGLPTQGDVNLTSADGGPLRMEAVQRLAQPIALACCSELDVALTNADTQAGPVHLGVLLSDTSVPNQPSVLLGFQELASNGTGFAASPVGLPQSAHFTITPSRALRRFNRITVVVIPSIDAWRGAKIAIQGFTLIPK